MNKQTLQPSSIVNTIGKLHERIGERFPNSGLRDVCLQLHVIAQNMETRAEWIGKPVMWLRYLTWCVCILIVILAIAPFYLFVNTGETTKSKSVVVKNAEPAAASTGAGAVEPSTEQAIEVDNHISMVDVVTLMEAGINDIVLIGAAIFFLLTIETRYKRQRALKALHELRSLAHVIDMHQLTKDPHRITSKAAYTRTGNSPKMNMTEFQLRRYLDYCSEMLSLTGKIAAVYVQEFDDGVAMASASELETLTSGLSSKIWQKISILDTLEHEDLKENAAPDSNVQPDSDNETASTENS